MAADNLPHDTATAATRALLEALFWPIPDEAQAEIGQQIYEIVLAATTFALNEQRETLLKPQSNSFRLPVTP